MIRPARAQMLASLGALAFAGCDARHGVAHVVERVRGCVDVWSPSAAGTRVERGTFRSAHVTGAVRCALIVPENVPRLDAVAYVLPGRGGDANSVVDLGFDGFLAVHVRSGGKPFALAVVDAGESYFHRRASGEDRLAVATVEFPSVVRAALGVPALREAIMGQSMGGYGALLAAEREPHRYRAVAVAGPAIFPSYADENRSVGDAFDSPADYARHDVLAHAARLRGRPVHVSCGARDPFLPGVRMFASACPTADVVVAPGCHDAGFWRASAAALIAFAGAHL
ncbi:MAG: putative esterase [Candidatus Eremiobacteraeota bacterium]|nr:putative esterase [Candidatus Eremiobacteraeota bacterium]